MFCSLFFKKLSTQCDDKSKEVEIEVEVVEKLEIDAF